MRRWLAALLTLALAAPAPAKCENKPNEPAPKPTAAKTSKPKPTKRPTVHIVTVEVVAGPERIVEMEWWWIGPDGERHEEPRHRGRAELRDGVVMTDDARLLVVRGWVNDTGPFLLRIRTDAKGTLCKREGKWNLECSITGEALS